MKIKFLLLVLLAALPLCAQENQTFVQFFNQGSSIGGRTGYVPINCGSGILCTLSSGRFTLTASGGAGEGTVTAFTVDCSGVSSVFNCGVTNGTSTPNLAITFASAFPANQVFANCTGSPASPAPCSLTAAMIPDLSATYAIVGRQIITANSLTGGGTLAADRTLQLVNDASAPGASEYYGTNGSGTKGWFALPSGSGSPGGISGQIQWNNAGSFAGFTASGDCTITTSTGVVVCTKTNGTAFTALATTAPGTGIATWLATPTVANLGTVLGSQTQNFFLAAPSGSSGNFAARAIVASDIPTLNQNTTGNAATVTTSASATNSSFSILAVPSTSGSQAPNTILNFTINPSTGAVNIPGAITVSSCSGCGGGSLPSGPTSPNGVAQVLTSTPSGGVAGSVTYSLSGVPVNNNSETTCASQTLNVLDRATSVFCSGGSTATFTFPVHSTSGFGSGFPFVIANNNSGTMTLTPTTDTIDNGTLLSKWVDFIYNNASGNWQTIQIPQFAAFGSTCSNGTTWSTSTGIGCLSAAPIKSGDSAGGSFLNGTYPNPGIVNNSITATQLAAQYSKGSCTEVWSGSGTSSALQSGDDAISNNTCYNDSGVTRTITAVKCRSSAASNTTTVNPTFGSAGTGTTILSGAVTCGSTYAYSSSGTVTNSSWTTGSGIDPAMGGTLTGTSIAVIVEYTY